MWLWIVVAVAAVMHAAVISDEENLTDTKARIPDSKREKQRASAVSFSFFC